MEYKPLPTDNPDDICHDCGCRYGDHRGKDDACPLDEDGRDFSDTRVFTPKPVEAEGPLFDDKCECGAIYANHLMPMAYCPNKGSSVGWTQQRFTPKAGAEATGKSDRSDNELIAEFMGYTLEGTPSLSFKYWRKKTGDETDVLGAEGKLEYHKSWDWLMPVVERIPTLNKWENKRWFEYKLVRCNCHIYSNDKPSIEFRNNGGTLLDATYRTVVEFIKWYISTHTS